MRIGTVLLAGQWVLATFLLAQPCQLPPLEGSLLPGDGEVYSCIPPALPTTSASLAILVDDSGSMGGHREAMSQLLQWLRQATGRLEAHGVRYRLQRACYFSSERPLEACSSAGLNAGAFAGRGETTLVDAVRYASRFDLAVIVTDGVGTVGNGQACAAGVDAACLGAALSAALEPRPGEPVDSLAGLWLVPLASDFEGTFFTEQPFSPESLNPDTIASQVGTETGRRAVIRNPRLDPKGNLVYHYSGPRYFLLLILARPAELGRALLAALAGTASFNQVQLGQLSGPIPRGLAYFPPIEVFPGAVPALREFVNARLDEKACRTLSVDLRKDEVHLDCPNPADEGTLHLWPKPQATGSECVIYYSLPVARAQLLASDPTRAPVTNYRWRQQGPGQFRLSLRVRCSRSWTLPCPARPVVVSWQVQWDYPGTASRIAAHPTRQPEQWIRTLTAASVIDRPHRLLQLGEMLEVIYRRIAARQPSRQQELLRLKFCKP